jgi:hypothetical protein
MNRSSLSFLAGLTALAVFALVSLRVSAAVPADFQGRWEMATSYPGGSFVAGLDLAADAAGLRGQSGYLVPDSSWYRYQGRLVKEGLELTILGPDGKQVFGHLTLTIDRAGLKGHGMLHGKEALPQLPKPPAPKSIFCQASWGCTRMDDQ